MNRRLLVIDPASRQWRLWSVHVEALQKDPREDYWVLSGEALCQYLLRRDPEALVIARGPLPFLSGNKATIGYVSPLTGLPHYSFVGGHVATELLNLGLDAIWLQGTVEGTRRVADAYLVVSGRAPDLTVEWKEATGLPTGQRSACYWLLERELGGDPDAGSILTLGEGARFGYLSANLAAEAIFHAGRGGAGIVLARSAAAMVLRGLPMGAAEFFAGEASAPERSPEALLMPLLRRHCAWLSGATGGTITGLFATGGGRPGKSTLPAWNAQRLGYALYDLGSPRVLRAIRRGHTGCDGCQVRCRHWRWVPADYAPGGRDLLLDDMGPAYAIYAMLGLGTVQRGDRPLRGREALRARLDLLADVDRRLTLPIEQMGCDVIDIGLGLSALLEGVKLGAIPKGDVPEAIANSSGLGDLEAAAQAVEILRLGQADGYPALRAAADGPQALAGRYPAMQSFVFTCGKGTLGNPGRCNALWTFLMPFSRFFGDGSARYDAVDESLPPPGSDEEAYRACFARVVRRLLQREWFGLVGNVLSLCAFTFGIFSEGGTGERLDEDLLLRLLRRYGIRAMPGELAWFGQAFWAQSIDLKCRCGWQPPAAADLPRRVYEALSEALGRPVDEVQALMELLIAEWKQQAREVMARFGYDAPW